MIAFRTLPRSPPFLLGLGFLFLAVLGIGSVLLVGSLRAANEWVVHTLDVENKLSYLLLNIRRAESSQRGYILTGTGDYEDDYRNSVGVVSVTLAELQRLIADNPVQVRNVAQLEPALAQRLNELETVLRTVKEGGPGVDAGSLIRLSEGRRHMQGIRKLAETMMNEERRLLAERTQASDRLGRLLLLATVAGSALILALAVVSVASLRRSSRERDDAFRLLEETNANLETTIAERTADLREANEEIQRFAYIVSHDLRSPLVNIMGFTSELEALRAELFEELRRLRAASAAAQDGSVADKEATLHQDFDEALGFIKSSIGKMDRLIGAILRLSREGRRQFRPEPVDMGSLLGSIGQTLAHQAAEAQATVSVGALPPVTSDRLALEQVFSNLLDNALKYLKPGVPGRVEVKGRANPAQVVYEVSDNGRGIDAKDHQRIFELFRRAGEQDRPGEGIGLAHVRALVRRLGGSLTVHSELGKGSVFTVTLPARWSEPKEKMAA